MDTVIVLDEKVVNALSAGVGMVFNPNPCHPARGGVCGGSPNKIDQRPKLRIYEVFLGG